MINKRSILACLMALLMTFLASCGSQAPPPTYSEAQLQQIDQYKAGIVELLDRMDELEELIQ
ncbi:MAG: photosystem II protein PsbQ, partial [Okeania sp. SIO2H7]|nr:photosystem II protein PsbQ [Okeania sp. SIO2H7]